MKTYSAKTLEDAIKKACEDLQVSEADLFYEVTFEKKTLFTKRVDIKAY